MDDSDSRLAMTTPEQRRRNRRLGLLLLVFVLAVFAWTVFRGASLLSHMGTSP